MIYKIKSMNNFAKILGKTVAKDSQFTYNELKSYISVKNIKNIISKYTTDENGHCYITNNGIADSMSEIFDWLIGRELASLAAKDKIDCYWDDKSNEMIFNIKSNNDHTIS